MTVFNAVMCMLGAMIGAGFASGREIMVFFTRYGAFSWVLCGMLGAETGLLTGYLLWDRKTGRPTSALCRLPAFLLLIFTAGSMTAAAGALWALSVPLKNARLLGGGVTLLLCAAVCRRSLKVLPRLSRLLSLLLLLTVALCFFLPADAPAAPAADEQPLGGIVRVLGYGCLNVLMSAGLIDGMKGACTDRQKKRIAIFMGFASFALLSVENALLLRHADALRDAPMPVVVLLRALGKTGYFLSVLLIYLAVVTTLIAVLGGIWRMLPQKHSAYMRFLTLLTACIALLGFEGIVDTWYPILGWLCMLPLLL